MTEYTLKEYRNRALSPSEDYARALKERFDRKYGSIFDSISDNPSGNGRENIPKSEFPAYFYRK